MKKTNKRTLQISVLCACALVLVIASVSIFGTLAASDSKYVAEVGSTKYENYADAWAAVSNGGTITMLKDWHITEVLTVDENKSVTINMNGFMINRGLTDDERSGEVFLVDDDATLNINGESNSQVEHQGTIQADMWHYNKDGKHIIKGALITGGYNSNGGGAIHILDNAQVNMVNVTVAGNASTDGSGAGAIRLHGDDSKLTIYDSEICYNKVTDDGGAAIGVEGEGAVVQILGTKINNNVVTYGKGNGGAIQINSGEVSIAKSPGRVSEISFNTAGKNGGAIYISEGNLHIHEGTLIARNMAGKEGGAIYVDSDAGLVDIKGIFAGNSANEEGGAIYVNSNISGDKGAKISNAEFLGNHSVLHGGAIFVSSDNDIALSGKVIVNGNTPNNLYIQEVDTIKANSLTEGSRVGITTSWNATKSSPVQTSRYQYFVSDQPEYEIAGNSQSLYYVKTTTGAPESITVGDETYPVIKDIFRYYPNSGGQLSGYFYYSDGYFVESAKYYNEHLATMSTCVSVAAVNSLYDGEHADYKAARNIMDLLERTGFKAMHISYPEPTFYGADSDILATIGYVIARKDIVVNGETVPLVVVAVRGGKYGAEWASNVVLGDGGEAKGFDDAADQVEAGLYKYLEAHEIYGGKAKFWITGFSRAAATSNLVAKRLTDRYGEDDVYAYCFETPKGGIHSLLEDGKTYANIHNVVNPTDIVPFVGTSEMGFIRYGVDHMLPGYKVGTDEYSAQKAKMLAQLAAIAPNAAFNDYFHEATVSYFLSTIQGIFTDNAALVKEESFPDFGTAAEWYPYLIQRIQQYSFTNNVENSIYNKDSVNWQGYRNYWSTYKWYLYEDVKGNLLIKCYGGAPEDFNSDKYYVLTIEESVSTVMNFYFGMDGAKKDAIVSAIDLNTIKKNISVSDIYWDIIKKWNDFTIDEKNSKFNELWNATKIEDSLENVLTDEEMGTLKRCLYVLLDFGLDFVSDDYDHESQDLIGTLVYNISNIIQTHHYETLCAWTRSYDSFYASDDLVAPPNPPHASMEGGVYHESLILQLIPDDNNQKIYYTLDGTTPSPTNGTEYNLEEPICLDVIDGTPTITTIKAVAVYNGLASEVVTYNYYLNSNAIIDVYEDTVYLHNFDDSAYLVLAEYEGEDELLRNIEYFEVTDNDYFFFENSSLNFENKVVAYLVRDFDSFTPLCDSVCITDPSDTVKNIGVTADNVVEIESLEMNPTDNPNLINVTFTTKPNDIQILIVALYDQGAQSPLDRVVYFNQLEKNNDNTYTFMVEKARFKETLGGSSSNNSSFVLTVIPNGISETDTQEGVYVENVYTITYHLKGGTNHVKNPDVFTERTVPFFLSNPTREHYQFVGWYDSNGKPVYAIDPNETKQNIELYAKWEAFNYTVVYSDGVDGEEIFANISATRPYGSPTPELVKNPTREGYTFVGWDKEISPTIVGDVLYNAVWVKNHVHEPILFEGVDATCSSPGYKSYYECADCGYYEDESCLIEIADIELWKQTDGKLTAEHIFTEKVQDAAYLVVGTGTNCQDAVRYYYGCANCDAIGTEEWVSDTYGSHNIGEGFVFSDGQHYHACTNEGCDYITEKADCVGGTATCEAKAICAVCGHEYGELAGHTPDKDDGDCTTAIVCSICGEVTTPAMAEHKDENSDGKCDACEYKMPTDPDTGTDTETDTETEPETEPETETETETEKNTETDAEPDAETDAPDSSEPGKGCGRGCQSSVSFGAIALVTVLLTAGFALAKKEE